MSAGERAIRDGLRSGARTPDDALVLVTADLEKAETASLLVLLDSLVAGSSKSLRLTKQRHERRGSPWQRE